MASSVKHSTKSNEQYTPVSVVKMAREVLGSIDLDPATSRLANKRVRAKETITLDDGPHATFERQWCGNVFLNPPGGQLMVMKGSGYNSNPVLFWAKLMHAWQEEQTTRAAIFLGFTMEVLQASQSVEEHPMLRFPFCVPARRLAFDVPREEKIAQLQERLESVKKKERPKLEEKVRYLQSITDELVPGDAPPHGNVIVLVPPLSEQHSGVAVWPQDAGSRPWVGWQGEVTGRFYDVFSQLGYVRL